MSAMYSSLSQGALVRSSFTSRCLAGNPLGDPLTRDVLLYVPHVAAERRLPTIMLLPGFFATHVSMLGFNPFKSNTVEAFDRQLAAGECDPAILVMPDCMTRWGGSQFVDSPATGPYQTYLVDEVVPHVDANFNTIAGPEGRAVIGKSSGGFGALRLVMDRPGVFSAAGSHAGDAAFNISMRPMFTNAATAFDRAGGVTAFAKAVVDGGPKGGAAFDGLFVLACSAAYAPDLSAPLPHLALPFDPRTAELNEEVFGLWLDHDPLHRIEGSKSALASLRTVFLDSGNRDEHGLHFAARLMADRMRAHEIPVHHEEYDGGHRGTSYRYETSLPHLVAALRSRAPT